MSKNLRLMLLIIVVFCISVYIALPEKFSVNTFGINKDIQIPKFEFSFMGKNIQTDLPLKKGLDIQGGMQVVLKADMSKIALNDRDQALSSVREIISKRVDLYGINEPRVQTSYLGDEYRLIVELPGVNDEDQALDLIGKTAQLEFKLLNKNYDASASAESTASANTNQLFISTGLTGQNLRKSIVQIDNKTNQPIISLEFDEHGRELFAEITKNNVGEILAIIIDDVPITMPKINEAIYAGRASIQGDFNLEEARRLALQLNAGALPVPIEVIQQNSIGASLGQQSVQESIKAGLIGLGLVIIFMILYYNWKGVIASIALIIYSTVTIAIYKILGVTLTLPGIAGLILSIGMAVDSNILIFERMKEELRLGNDLQSAMELGFGRAWDSIKDANIASIVTALVLINPLDATFLNTSGLVRGFGVTLLIGVAVGIFTGVVVSRTLMRITLPLIIRIKND